MRLGEMLVSQQLVSQQIVDEALERQRQTGEPLGALLVSGNLLPDKALIEVLGAQHDMPTVRLSGRDAETHLAKVMNEKLSRHYGCVPFATSEHVLDVAFDAIPDTEVLATMSEELNVEVRPHLATRRDIESFAYGLYGNLYDLEARDGLRNREPLNSAATVITFSQCACLAVLAVTLTAALMFAPRLTAISLMFAVSVWYLLTTTYKLTVIALSSNGRTTGELRYSAETLAAIDERTLPKYTILIPLYKEAAVVTSLARGIASLDYPKSKLDVRLLCEEDDPETIQAVRALNLPAHFKLVVCPDTQPKTKPKACNYGLWQATGELVVIYDAEDRPDPQQLKKAVLAFRESGEDVVCVQGKLNYFNSAQNLLTRWFAAEYAMLFDLTLPGLARMRAPIPLGGTSNHFRREALMRVGAWDPFNVTEDADLGIRLYKAGYRTVMIDSTTFEEANSRVGNWIRQRSRWNKGYYITWLVHMRNPVRLLKDTGFSGFFSFQMMVASPFTLLINPVLWVLTAATLIFNVQVFDWLPLNDVSLFLLSVGNTSWIAVSVCGVCRRRDYKLIPAALLISLYWALMSVAAYKGFIQLITKPFYWEKTVHGLDNGHVDSPELAADLNGQPVPAT